MSILKIIVLSYLYTMGFRENLKFELECSGMLVKELADRSGVNKKTLDSYLGKYGYIPSAETAVNIARVLGVTVEYLVTGINSEKNSPRPFLPKDLQEIVQTYEHLNVKDRYVILNLTRLLKNK